MFKISPYFYTRPLYKTFYISKAISQSELSEKRFSGEWEMKHMVEKSRKKCPAGTRWNADKNECVKVRKKKVVKTTQEEYDDEYDENE